MVSSPGAGAGTYGGLLVIRSNGPNSAARGPVPEVHVDANTGGQGVGPRAADGTGTQVECGHAAGASRRGGYRDVTAAGTQVDHPQTPEREMPIHRVDQQSRVLLRWVHARSGNDNVSGLGVCSGHTSAFREGTAI